MREVLQAGQAHQEKPASKDFQDSQEKSDGQGFKEHLVFVDPKDQKGSKVKGAFQGLQAPLVHLETLE